MLAHLFQRLAFAGFMIALPVLAHHADVPNPLGTGPGPVATTATVQGRVDQIVVENRLTGTTRTFPVLVTGDGQRYLLSGAGSAGLLAGDHVAIAGKLDGRALYPEAIAFVAAAAVTAKAAPTASTTVEGTLRLGHADNFDGTPSDFFYAVVTDDGRHVRADLATLLDGLDNGLRVAVSGTPDTTGDLHTARIVIQAAATPKAAPAISAKTAVATSYIVLPIKFPTNAAAPFTYGSDPFTPAALSGAVFGPTANSVNAYYNEVSYGQQTLSGIVADNGAGGFLQAAVAAPSSCDITAIASAAENAATARGYDLTKYTGRLYVFNNVSGCGWSGLAYVSWARAYSNNSSNLLVIAHELGHNFGLAHAASVDCAPNVIGGTCTSAEYGDPFDVMGNQRAMHFSAAQKSLLNWLPAGGVATHVGGTQTYTLAPLESAGGTTYAVKVQATANRTYWIEYRQPVGFDSGLSAFPNSGAQIRVANPFESLCSGCYDDTEFLDFTPATTAFTDGTLAAGQSFIDSTYNITFNVLAATPAALTVQIISGGGATTTTTVTAAPNPSVTGGSVVYTATVTGSSPPAGTVAFSDGATTLAGCGAVALIAGGTATCTTSALTAAASPHVIKAAFSGGAGFAASSGIVTQVVNKAATVTTISAHTPNPVNVGSAIAVTAAVAATAPGSGTPTGTITVSDGAANCAITLPANSCSLIPITAGAKTLTAVFSGDANFATSTSAGVSHTVSPAALSTTTGVTASLNPSVAGGAVMFTATVSASTLPIGTVAFTDGASTLAGCGAVVLNGAGTATCSTSALTAAASPHVINATFSGSAGYAASNGSLTQVVNKAATTTTITANTPNPVTLGSPVSVTAGVAVSIPGSGTPSGTITVSDGSATCAITLPAISCNLTPLTAGTKTLTAVYGGDTNFATSTSASVQQTVNAAVAATTTTVTASPNPSVTGSTVLFTATVTGGASPTGTVAFADGATMLAGCGAVALSGTQTATCFVNTLTAAAAPHIVKATYSGSAGYAPSSGTLTLAVNKAATTTTISLHTPNPANVGALVAVSAGVSVTSPGAGSLTGTITVSDGSATCAFTLPATGCSLIPLTAGAKTLTATYAGDVNFTGSTSAGVSQTVNSVVAPTITTLTASPDASASGSAVVFTATVTGVGGTVSFADGATTLAGCGAVALSGTGTAACSTTALTASASPHGITATYSGSAGYASSTGMLMQVVNKAATAIAISAHTPDPANLGTPIAVTASLVVSAPGSGTPSGTIIISDGTAHCIITLPAASCGLIPLTAGTKTLTAVYAGDANFASSTSVGVVATVNGGVPSGGITIISGNAQSTHVGSVFATPLQVRILDTVGNPVGGAIVNWSTPNVGASAIPSATGSITDAQGYAQVMATANAISGAYAVTASVGDLTQAFSLTNTVTPSSGLPCAATTSTVQDLVEQAYQVLLQRPSDAGGKAYWTGEASRLCPLGIDPKQTSLVIGNVFLNSSEYASLNRSDSQFVTDIYVAFLDRLPDSGGLNYWTGQLGSGLPRNVVLNSFLFAPEFSAAMQAVFGAGAGRSEVSTIVDLYGGLFRRLPDSSGFAYWQTQFRRAQCTSASAVAQRVDDITKQFLNGAEYLGRGRTNSEYVQDLYYSFLRRGGDLPGFNYWVSLLDSGRGREDLRQQFLASPEMQDRITQIAAETCLQ